MVAENAQPRVTIGEGRRTDVDIPLILSGQIRGTVFIDENENGSVDPGERRLEGHWVKLFLEEGGETRSIQTASFGQYGFENVAPGRYRILVNISGAPVTMPIEISDQDPFINEAIPIPPALYDGEMLTGLDAVQVGEP